MIADVSKMAAWKRPKLHRHLDTPRRVLLRDFLIFEIKLVLDGLKGVGISLLALPALGLDLLHPGSRMGQRFYGVMRLGERLDRWLSLYGVAEAAEGDPEGLFGVSRAGSPTLLGRMEALVNRAVVGQDDGPTDDPARPQPSAPPEAEPRPDSAATGNTEAAAHRPLGSEQVVRATGKAGALFDRGLAALDRAVDKLDPPAPGAGPGEPG
jgi:hypothetical protein